MTMKRIRVTRTYVPFILCVVCICSICMFVACVYYLCVLWYVSMFIPYLLALNPLRKHQSGMFWCITWDII